MKVYINSLLDEFRSSFVFLDKRHLELLKAMTTTNTKYQIPDPKMVNQVVILEVYRDTIYGKFLAFKAKDATSPAFITELSDFFTSCMQQSVQAVTKLNDNRPTATAIFDFMKEVANFCKKYLYMLLGREPQFFTTTTTPIENI